MSGALVIRNNLPVVGWVFTSLWLFGLGVFTWLYARDGGFNQFDPLLEAGVMLFFWMGGLVLINQLGRQPITCLTVRRGGATVVRRWLWKRREQTLPTSVFREMTIRRERDSDGDPYYRLVATPPNDEDLIISECGDLARVEAVRDSILARL